MTKPAISSLERKKKRISDYVLLFLIYLSAFLAVAILVGIIAYVAYKGIPSIDWTFL